MDFILPFLYEITIEAVFDLQKSSNVVFSIQNLITKGRMTPYGEYKAKVDPEGIPIIDTEEFVTVNWPLLSEIAGWGIPPRFHILSEKYFDVAPTFFGICTQVHTRHHEVWLYPPKLEKDACEFCRLGGHLVAGLWAILATTLRLILTSEGIIPTDQYIGAKVARRGGFLKSVTRSIHKQMGRDDTHSIMYRANFDAWVIYNAIYGYFQLFDVEETVDVEVLRTLIRAEKDSIGPNFFR